MSQKIDLSSCGLYLQHAGRYPRSPSKRKRPNPVPRLLTSALTTVTLAALLLCLSASVSHAEAPELEANYSAGKSALKAGKLDDALGHFKEALTLSAGDEGRTWQMLLAIALTYMERDEPQHAIEYYRRFLKQTEGDLDLMPVKWKKRRKRASEDLAELERQAEATHGFVSIVTAPKGAKVRVDGKAAGADGDAKTPHATILRAGEHTIEVTLEGYESVTKTLMVRAGGAHPIKVTLTPKRTALPPPERAIAPPASVEAVRSPSTDLSASMTLDQPSAPWGPWLTIGLAGTMAATGAVMTVLAANANKDAEALQMAPSNPDDLEASSAQWEATLGDIQTYQLSAGVLYGAALAAAAGGVLWMLLIEPDSPSTSLSITPTEGGAYGSAMWSF